MDGNQAQQFAGKVAVVTGGTSGSGEATARLIASRGAAGLVICGRSRERGEAVAADITAQGCPTLFVQADLADVNACFSVIDQAEARFGRIDALCNVAGLSTRGGVADTTPEIWDTLFAVNVRAPFFLIQRTVAVMRKHGIAGAIANIGSIVAYGGPPFLTPYATTKGALVTLTRNLANSLKRDRIRVNTLNIGWTNTPWEHVIQTRTHGRPENWLEEVSKAQPFGRLIEPEEVARALAFLVSDESGLMTGAIIEYDQTVIGTTEDNPGV
jgi:NAD(P)-dependent dehydrogenase (short-subunit alcohol dehydrogenase family)